MESIKHALYHLLKFCHFLLQCFEANWIGFFCGACQILAVYLCTSVLFTRVFSSFVGVPRFRHRFAAKDLISMGSVWMNLEHMNSQSSLTFLEAMESLKDEKKGMKEAIYSSAKKPRHKITCHQKPKPRDNNLFLVPFSQNFELILPSEQMDLK